MRNANVPTMDWRFDPKGVLIMLLLAGDPPILGSVGALSRLHFAPLLPLDDPELHFVGDFREEYQSHHLGHAI